MTLGYISAFSDTLALAVIGAKGIPLLVNCLVHEPEDHIKAARGRSGRLVTTAPTMPKQSLTPTCFRSSWQFICHEESSDDLTAKAKRAMKSIIEKCVHLPTLQPLLHTQTPVNIVKYVVHQFAKVLPHDVKWFVSSDAIWLLQDIEAEPGSKLEGAR
jgi:hypothetical protein